MILQAKLTFMASLLTIVSAIVLTKCLFCKNLKNLIAALFLSSSYKSNEDYVYVRGRGRGKYICEECGIRCKKPSMLKKHIRTHTDIRPYVCKFCNFAFKTKGRASFILCVLQHAMSKPGYSHCATASLLATRLRPRCFFVSVVADVCSDPCSGFASFAFILANIS